MRTRMRNYYSGRRCTGEYQDCESDSMRRNIKSNTRESRRPRRMMRRRKPSYESKL
jgi:hypothetical protein